MAHNHLATPDPELAPLLAQLPPPAESIAADLAAARHAFDTLYLPAVRSAQKEHLPSETEYISQDHKVAVDNGEVRVRSYVPTSEEEGKRYPLLFWTHGGGWVFGDIDMDDYYMRILSVALQLVIVQVEYRLAPEHPFPTSLNDSYAALKWAVQNAESLKADLSKGFLVGGASAGGNLAAVLAHRFKADPDFAQHPLTGQVLQYPITVHPDVVPDEYKEKYTAYEQMAQVQAHPSRHMREFLQMLQGPPADPEVSPLLQPSFEGLAPAYVQACGMDPLRDDALVYAARLGAAGVPTRLDIYPGTTHGFNFAFPHTKVAQKFEEELKEGIRWLLSGAPPAN